MNESKRVPHRALTAAACLLGAAPALAADAWDPATHQPATITAVRVAEPPQIDGRLDEAIWSESAPFELPYETRPSINGPAPVRTLAWIAYDDDHLYFAIRAEDPEPERIRAHFSDRDRGYSDDRAGVILDTFHDGRRAFEFFVNPLGVQDDILEDDVTGGDDPSWDAIWDSAGRLTDDGYEIEAAIPFSSLRYPRTSGDQVWGFNAVRFWPRSSFSRIALEPRDPERSCLLCQLADLEGITGLEPRLDIELDPTVTSSRTDVRDPFPGGRLAKDQYELEAGLSARWGITPNLSLNATINPDFSQVETDSRQLEVNRQFALFFPEKRPFFLEGADLFDTGFDLVHTRVVADPDWGVKLTGKEGANAVGLLVARDTITNLLFPGSQGSSLDSLAADSLASVFRYRRDLPLNGSTLGVLYTGRQADQYQNHTFGADALLRLTDRQTARIEAFASETDYPTGVATDNDQPIDRFGGHALRLSWGFQSQEWEGHAQYRSVGRGFRADLGFLPRVDYREASVSGERIWRGGSDDWYDRLELGLDVDETRDQSGDLLDREVELFWSFEGAYQSRLFVEIGQRDRVYQGVRFDQDFLYFNVRAQPTASIGLSFRIFDGDAIDFDNVRPGDAFEVGGGLSLQLGRHASIDLSHDIERLDVAGGELFEAALSRLTMVYQFSRRTQVRLISQYVDVRLDPTLYREEVDARSKQLANQLLFSWKLNPQTVVFAGYSDQLLGDHAVGLTRESRTLFLKLGYAWLP